MMNEDQELDMKSLKKNLLKKIARSFISRNQLQYSREVHRPLCVHVLYTNNYTLTETANYIKAWLAKT